VRASAAGTAPLNFDVKLPDGKPLKLVCYAFTANKYEQDGRPTDEHRFQVKYGSDFKRLHNIYIDSTRAAVTLFFGVYEDGDLFVAADPALHNPTWFSSSIEFKAADVKRARRSGWHGWQRDRVATGRRRTRPIHPDESFLTETLHGFTAQNFLTYARFERVATGITPGDRFLLIQNIGSDLRTGGPAQALIQTQILQTDPDHELLRQFGLPIDDVLELIANNPRLRTAVRGGVAERHLQQLLGRTPGVSALEKLNRDGEPDFSFTYQKRPLRLECKLVSPLLTRGFPRVDFQKTRASKADPCSRYYSSDQFELLAACTHPVTGEWTFRYALTRGLPAHRVCSKKISDRILVDEAWPDDLRCLL